MSVLLPFNDLHSHDGATEVRHVAIASGNVPFPTDAIEIVVGFPKLYKLTVAVGFRPFVFEIKRKESLNKEPPDFAVCD